MAGDWLKMEASTPDKRETLAITEMMGWDDADLTVGKLFRVWRWFDAQTLDGNAHGVTTALLDRVAGAAGFAKAMAAVGWLTIVDDGIALPNFDRHNGETAKARALTAKRVAKSKDLAKGNAASVTSTVSGALPRKEKKREEKRRRKPSTTSGGAAAGAPIISRLRELKVIGSNTPARIAQLADDWVAEFGAAAVIAEINTASESIRAAEKPAQYVAAIVRRMRKEKQATTTPENEVPEVAPITRSEAALTFATRTAWPIVAECGDPDASDISRRKFNQQSGLSLDPGDVDQWAKWVRVCREVGLDPKGRKTA